MGTVRFPAHVEALQLRESSPRTLGSYFKQCLRLMLLTGAMVDSYHGDNELPGTVEGKKSEADEPRALNLPAQAHRPVC